MFVPVQALGCKLSFEPKLLKVWKHAWLDRNLVLSDNEPLSFIDRRVGLSVPIMFFYGLNSKTSIRVNFHYLAKKVLTVIAETFRHLELPGEDLLVKFTSVFIFERQIPSYHREQNNAAWPDVNAWAIVQLPLDHFRCCVAGTSTRCFQSLTLFICVAQSEVNQLQVVLIIKKEVLGLEVSVDDTQFVKILNTWDYLLEKFASLLFF